MVKKYRPYLTIPELEQLIRDCSSISLKKYLAKFLRDIDTGYISPQITVNDSIEQKLGISPKERDSDYEIEQQRRYLADEMSSEEEKSYELSQGVNLS